MSGSIKAIQYGVGAIGKEIAKLAIKNGIEIVGAIDIDENKVGKDLGKYIGLDKEIGIKISNDSKKVLSESNANIVLHSTSSYLENIKKQIIECIEAGLSLISTCEELAYPFYKNFEIAKEIDYLAKEKKVSIIGTGINPGFVMDTLAIIMTYPCQEVNRITINRIVDASKRRLPLQRKVGIGLSIDEFNEKIKEKNLGHVGLTESLALIADAINLKIDKINETIKPIITKKFIKTNYLKAKKGFVIGIKQKAIGIERNEEKIILNLQMYANAKNPRDEIIIEGIPPINLKIKNGIAGDLSTPAIIVNTIPVILNSKPGLLTMKDLVSLKIQRNL